MEHIQSIIIGFGYVGIGSAVFAESGLFFGAFLPGDSLLFTVGLFSSQGYFHILLLWAIVVPAAILGDNVGYMFGKMVGPKIFTKKDSLLFRQSHILRAHEFYERHGKKTIIMARFVPIIRTFAPIVAGVGSMHYKTFVLFNIAGGLLWGTLLLGLGYGVGSFIPNAGKYLEWIVIGIIALSILPIVIEYLGARKNNR
jgi:membrane-associated protein